MRARETEAKLLAASEEQLAAIGGLDRIAGLALGPRQPVREQDDLYLDTDDFRLYRAGLSLRYRRKGGRTLVTLKEIPESSGRSLLANREEMEEQLPEMPADTTAPPPGDVGRRVVLLVSDRPLVPVARILNRREKLDLGESAGGIELCLDRVRVLGPAGEDPIASFFEVELEDRGAGEAPVRRAAEELRSRHALLPSPLSKLERALAARGLLARARGADRTFDTTVVPSDRLIDAAFRVFRKHFERMKANEPGTRLGENPEFLHDMRVSTRRIRAAFRTFGPALSPRTISGHNRNLRRVAGALGEVRDLDVYLERLPDYSEMLPEAERDALLPFEAWLRRRRVKARARMARTLDSRRYAAFLARFERFLERGAPKRPGLAPARVPVGEAAPNRIGKALRRVLKAGRAIPAKSPAPRDMHRLRILVKRLRYACEFFSDLYGPRLERFVRTTVALQDLLGAHQDACVAGDVLRRFAERLPAGRRETVRTALALGRLIAAQDAAAAESRRGFRRVFAAFDRKKVRKRMLTPR